MDDIACFSSHETELLVCWDVGSRSRLCCAFVVVVLRRGWIEGRADLIGSGVLFDLAFAGRRSFYLCDVRKSWVRTVCPLLFTL